MPQFLQRKIRKYSNGLVMLYDTTKMVIIPTCTLNQTWLFDSIANKNATCTATGTQVVFGVTDSVKTIMVNNTDTVKLSKSFGFIVFPKPYGVNKYYRLVGIENKTSYDPTSLFGEKVPNAWDFFDFSPGEVFTKKNSNYYKTGMTINSYYSFTTYTIQSKSSSANGYTYTVAYQDASGMMPGVAYAVDCHDNPPPFGVNYSTGTTQLTYSNLSAVQFGENYMYPGMYVNAYGPNTYSFVSAGGCGLPENIVKFGKDNTGRFYKYMGKSCPTYTFPVMPNSSAIDAYEKTGNYAKTYTYGYNQYCVGSGVGAVNNNCFFFEAGGNYSLGSFIKNGVTLFGQPWVVGVNEHEVSEDDLKVYPNPADRFLYMDIHEPVVYTLTDILGHTIRSSGLAPGESVDTKDLTSGIYFIFVKGSKHNFNRKIIIQH
jgi:hypothetical protein